MKDSKKHCYVAFYKNSLFSNWLNVYWQTSQSKSLESLSFRVSGETAPYKLYCFEHFNVENLEMFSVSHLAY